VSAGDVLWERQNAWGRTLAELVDEEDHLTLTVYEEGEAAAIRLPHDAADDLEDALRGWRLER
jgi:hypothetical protein